MTQLNNFVLKNGVRVVIVPVQGLRSTTVEVFLKIGSKYETSGQYGMSHFLEHMAFKGTKKRPTATDINNEIDTKGADYNAGTGHEMTSYHITTVRENVPWAIEMLFDILTNSLYENKEVEKEKGVVMEEIRMYQDNPMMGLSNEFVKFLYGKSNIGCWNIAGEVKDIELINRARMINFRNSYFNPKEMVVVIAGDIGNEIIGSVRECFESVEMNSKKLPEVKMLLNEDRNKKENKKTEQGHFCVGLPTIPRIDKRKYGMKLLDIILWGNTSSRLYSKIREERGWAYYVFSVSESFQECGFLGMQSGVKVDKVDEAIGLVYEELIKVGNDLKDIELIRAKDFLIGKTKLMMDRSDFWSTFVGQKLLLENELKDPEEELERYKSITFDSLKKLASEFLVKDKIRSMSISP